MEHTILISFIICSLCTRVYSTVSLFPENVQNLSNARTLSTDCLNQLQKLNEETFLLMFDSSTKVPTGILGGNLWDLGDFDECYNIESTIENEIIYGKYCLGTVALSAVPSLEKFAKNLTIPRIRPIHPNTLRSMPTTAIHLAICVPHKCSSEELAVIPSFTEEFCYTKHDEPELTTGSIITLIVLIFFLFLAVLSTIFDIYLYYTDKKPHHELLIAFSVLTNGRKLFSTTTNPDQLSCLNGMRVISLMWVILGHHFGIGPDGLMYNGLDLSTYINDQWNMLLLNATISVDVFFTIGGIVIVYAFFKSMDKGVKFNIIMFYIHRYLRLTPALAVCIVIYMYLLKYIYVAPIWKLIEPQLVDTCLDGWWGTILYISNFVNTSCMDHSWYLSVDMQLFVLSPIVLLTLKRWEKLGLSLLGILCILGVVVPFSVVYGYELKYFSFADDKAFSDYNRYYYLQTHSRFGPYVIGMLFGYLIYKSKKGELKIPIRPIYACAVWLMSLTGLMACVYAPYDAIMNYERLSQSFVLGFLRPAFGLGVAIVVFLCVSGYGGPINAFLSLPIFQILAKLTYSMYLVHYAIVFIQFYRLKAMRRFSNYELMFTFWGSFMLTLVFAIILCLGFESPIIILEKHIFGRAKTVEKSRKPEP